MKRLMLRHFVVLPVLMALCVQVILFSMSDRPIAGMSAFCTASMHPILKGIAIIHPIYAILFIAGIFSIFRERYRIPYLASLSVMLIALPLQVLLVRHGYLWCDPP